MNRLRPFVVSCPLESLVPLASRRDGRFSDRDSRSARTTHATPPSGQQAHAGAAVHLAAPGLQSICCDLRRAYCSTAPWRPLPPHRDPAPQLGTGRMRRTCDATPLRPAARSGRAACVLHLQRHARFMPTSALTPHAAAPHQRAALAPFTGLRRKQRAAVDWCWPREEAQCKRGRRCYTGFQRRG
jgi:hypothetical protein